MTYRAAADWLEQMVPADTGKRHAILTRRGSVPTTLAAAGAGRSVTTAVGIVRIEIGWSNMPHHVILYILGLDLGHGQLRPARHRAQDPRGGAKQDMAKLLLAAWAERAQSLWPL